MSFTMLSAALLLLVGAGVFIEVMRGLDRGLTRTAMTLSSVVLAALVAIPLAMWLSDLPCKMLGELLLAVVPSLKKLTEQFPSIPVLVQAGVDTLLSPLLFVILFLLLRLICRIVLAIVFKEKLRTLPEEIHDPLYESAHAPVYRRRGRLVSGLTGGLCGFLASMMLLSPVVGTLCTARDLLRRTEAIPVKWSAIGLSEEQVAMVENTVSDPGATLLEAMGGGLIFDAVANTRLNGRRVTLRSEVEACMTVVGDMLASMRVFSSPAAAGEEELAALERLSEEIERSEAAKLLAADFLNQIARAWLEGKTFMKIPKPSGGELVDPLLNGILQVCAESTPDCVARDIGTLIRIYLIASEHGLLTSPDYGELAEQLDEGGVLGLIYDELMDNPCTAHLAGELTDMALRIMAKGIKWSGFNDAKLDSLMSDLSDAMNLVNGMGSTYEDRVASMKEYTLYYAEQYGVELPDSLAEMAAAALVDRLGESGGNVTAKDLSEIFDQYLNGG